MRHHQIRERATSEQRHTGLSLGLGLGLPFTYGPSIPAPPDPNVYVVDAAGNQLLDAAGALIVDGDPFVLPAYLEFAVVQMGQSNNSGVEPHIAAFPAGGYPNVSFFMGGIPRLFQPGYTSADFTPPDATLAAGPEFGLAAGLTATGNYIWIAKAAAGGTPITDAMPGGAYNQTFINAMSALVNHTHASTVIYLLQRSGEKEAANPALAAVIDTTETSFLAYARSLAPGRTVFLLLILTNANDPGLSDLTTVRTKLAAVASADAHAWTYDPAWVPTFGVHDDGNQQDTVGAAAAAFILSQ